MTGIVGSITRPIVGRRRKDTVTPVVFNSPADLPGIVLWLDGSDSANIYKTAGTQPFGLGSTAVSLNNDPVACWADKSGIGNHMNQSVGGSQPAWVTGIQNGLAAVRANWGPFLYATSSILSQTANVTVFHASGYAFDADRGCLYAATNGDGNIFECYHDTEYDTGFNYGIWLQDSTGVARSQIPSDIGVEWHQFTHTKVGTTLTSRLDGTAGTPVSAAGDGVFTNDYSYIFRDRGGAYPTDGWIGDLIVVDGDLSAAWIAACEAWLKAKWATP